MNLFVTIVMDAVSYAAWLFLIGVGLTLVFGVLRLLNVAHGGFYSFGAYMAAYGIGVAGSAGFGVGVQFLIGAALAVVAGGLLGLAVELGILRRLYRHPEALVLLATYAIFLMLEDLTKMIWGGRSLYANGPRDSLGQVAIGSLQYPVYDLLLVLAAPAVAGLIWFVLGRTRIGHQVTALVFDREISAAMGIDVGRVMTATFIIGSALGALAGALTAPKIAISPGLGVEVIVLAFAVVVIGGLGSIGGAVVGALVVGLARAATAHLLPELAVFSVYAAMAAILALRPHGLFARAEARKI